MPTRDRVALKKRRVQLTANVRAALKVKDAEAVEENLKALDEAEEEEADPTVEDVGEDTHTHIHVGDAGVSRQEFEDLRMAVDSIKSTMDSMSEALKEKVKDAEQEEEDKKAKDAEEEAAKKKAEDEANEIAEEADEKVKDSAKKAKDSAYLEDSYQETVALAEILSPGIRIQTFDRKAEPKKTFDALCHLRRTALELAYNTVEGRNMVEEVHGKPMQLAGMHCRDVKTLFRAAAAVKKQGNNGARDVNRRPGPVKAVTKVQSLAELNAAMKAHYKV